MTGPLEPFAVCVPWDIARTGPNALVRLHPMARARLYRRAHAAALAGWIAAGRPEAPGAVAVTLLVRRGRVMDDDDAYGGAKPCRDRIFSRNHFGEGITPDDSGRYFSYEGVAWETGKVWTGREEVVFLVRPQPLALSGPPEQ